MVPEGSIGCRKTRDQVGPGCRNLAGHAGFREACHISGSEPSSFCDVPRHYEQTAVVVANSEFFLRYPPSILILVQPYRWVLLDEVEINSVTEQLANVRDAVFDHGWPLQAQTETENPHVLGQTHGLMHLSASPFSYRLESSPGYGRHTSNISGLKIPELPISMSLLSPLWCEKISILGSV